MDADAEVRAKRIRLRSWRRGMREVDLLLGPFADAALGALDEAELAAYERLLEAPDQDLYGWICGRPGAPADLAPIVDRIAAFHRAG